MRYLRIISSLYSAVEKAVFPSECSLSAVLRSVSYSLETHPLSSNCHGCLTLHFAMNRNEHRARSLKPTFSTAVFGTIALSLCLFLPSAHAAEKDNFQFKKQPELQQIKPKKPVKIKLRRSAKDEYTWELTGDDVDDIIKTDKKLRKMLNTQ